MRKVQIILGVVTLIMALSMFGFNLWIGANFSNGLELPQCFIPMNYITTALVLIVVVIIFARK